MNQLEDSGFPPIPFKNVLQIAYKLSPDGTDIAMSLLKDLNFKTFTRAKREKMKSTHVIASIFGSLTLIVTTSAMSADTTAVDTHALSQNVYYQLTPEVAKQYNIDLEQIKKDIQLQPNQHLMFKVDQNKLLDLSIFQESIFSGMRTDIRD